MEGQREESIISPHRMELVSQGSIELYETYPEFSHNKVERTRSQLERLTPEVPTAFLHQNNELLNNDKDDTVDEEITTSSTSDDLYQRIYELAETVEREINSPRKRQPQEGKEGGGTTDPLRVQNDDQIKEEQGEENEMAAKIRKALGKMKRLDNKLAELSRREKEIKKQRRLMEEYQSKGNTLTDVVSTNEGTIPVFSTQPHEKDDLHIECLEETESHTSQQTETHTSEEETHTHSKGNNNSIPSDTTANDFIIRNKELAGQANQPIPMTEAERKHLDSLLEEDNEEENNGYLFTENELSRLATIDSELDNLVPIINSRATSTMSTLLDNNNRTGQPGEKVLLLLQENRSEHTRLTEIDKQLETISNYYTEGGEEEEELMVPLTDAQIQFLIEQSTLEQQQAS